MNDQAVSGWYWNALSNRKSVCVNSGQIAQDADHYIGPAYYIAENPIAACVNIFLSAY